VGEGNRLSSQGAEESRREAAVAKSFIAPGKFSCFTRVRVQGKGGTRRQGRFLNSHIRINYYAVTHAAGGCR